LAPRRGRLIVIAGPSGVGKGSVVKELLSRDSDGLALSISATTRPPRPTEVDGRDYHFVDADAFDGLIHEHGLLEWAEVFGNRYGTPSEFVEDQRSSGRDVILEIDVQGAAQIRERVPEALLILLEPPSLDELARRLRGRGTESEQKIERRLAEAARELDQRNLFDHVVVNDDLRAASSQVAAIIEASRSDSEDPHP
jgi:guanylate kinase